MAAKLTAALLLTLMVTACDGRSGQNPWGDGVDGCELWGGCDSSSSCEVYGNCDAAPEVRSCEVYGTCD